jgi:hypothetical protein
MNPKSGKVRDHLLMCGFMDGYTRWQGDEDDDDFHAAAGNEEGQQGNNGKGGREDEVSPGHNHEGDVGHDHHLEEARHDEEDQEGRHDHEDEDARADGPSMVWVQDEKYHVCMNDCMSDQY